MFKEQHDIHRQKLEMVISFHEVTYLAFFPGLIELAVNSIICFSAYL